MRVCTYCGGALVKQDLRARYCDKQCAWAYWTLRKIETDPPTAADEDQDEPAVLAPLTYDYEAACMMCGRLQSEHRVDAVQALRLARTIPPLCRVCGGRVMVERVQGALSRASSTPLRVP